MKTETKKKLGIGAAIIAILLIFTSTFIVPLTERAIVLEFKKPVRIIDDPGLKFMWPWQNVQTFEKRVLDFNGPVKTIIAGDLKRLEVDAFIKYKISDPLKFLQSVANDETILRRRLDPILESSLRKVISEVPLSTLLSERRSILMNDIKTLVNKDGKSFGIEIVDVRIMRADFPDKNRNDIYDRMRSERKREAADLRAKGKEEATKIMAEADKQRAVILAEANKTAQITQGEGDGEATKIFAEAFNRDPEFFKFYRTLEAYRGSLKNEDTKLILSPDSEFLEYFDNSRGR